MTCNKSQKIQKNTKEHLDNDIQIMRLVVAFGVTDGGWPFAVTFKRMTPGGGQWRWRESIVAISCATYF